MLLSEYIPAAMRKDIMTAEVVSIKTKSLDTVRARIRRGRSNDGNM